MKYSIIFMVEEQDEQFPDFMDLIYQIFHKRNESFEILIVANATEGFLKNRLTKCCSRQENLKIISFQRTVSQALCLRSALNECSGDYVLTLGPFQELSATDYEKIIDSMGSGVDLVVPYRKNRHDSVLNRIHSKILNMAIKKVTGIKVNDIGCTVKLFRKELLSCLHLYGEMYRYVSVFAAQKGFKVKEVECEYFARRTGFKFYRPALYLRRLVEILNLFFSTRFSKKPLRFFNLVGLSLIIFGVIFMIFLSMEKIIYGIPIGDRKLLLVATIILVTGTQIASFGLLGEIVAFIYGRSQKEYSIEKII